MAARPFEHARTLLVIIFTAAMLVACGGGGGDSESNLLPSDSNSQNSSSGNSNSANTDSDTHIIVYDAIVEWDIPTTRVNGDELLLSEIGGYEIMYRNTNDELFIIEVVSDQTQSDFEITGLASGRYEVRVAAFDTDGMFSDYSDPAFADIGI